MQKRNKRKDFAHSSDDESESEDTSKEQGEQDLEEVFTCNVAVDSYRGLFYGFHWDAHRKAVSSLSIPDGRDSSWGSGTAWNVAIQDPRTSGKKRKVDEDDSDVKSMDEYKVFEDSEEEEDEMVVNAGMDEDEDIVMEPRTPSKKRARRDVASPRKTTVTPRKRTKTFAQPTPHSKAAARRLQASPSKRKQKFTVRPRAFPSAMSEWNLNLKKMPKDPWLRAMHMLHVGNRPDSLPCRDAEFENVLRCIGELLEEGSGGCVCECFSSNFPLFKSLIIDR